MNTPCTCSKWGLLVIADTCRSMSSFVFNTEEDAIKFRDKLLQQNPARHTTADFLIAKIVPVITIKEPPE